MAKKAPGEDYHIDGIVIKVNERHLHKNFWVIPEKPRVLPLLLNFRQKKLPRCWKAFRCKSAGPGNNSRSALAAGANYRIQVMRDSLPNLDEINRLEVRVGDTVLLRKAGDVIPKSSVL